MLPLEQLSHRLSRTWSPISHLNGVLNSDELRASYNACLPLLSNYWTDLAQSEPLFRAYTRHRRQRGRTASIPRSAASSNARSRISGWRASACLRSARRATRPWCRSWRTLGAKFEENVLDAMNAWTRLVTDERELTGINPGIVEQARVRATEKGVQGWLFALEQPTYVAVMTDARLRNPAPRLSTKRGRRAPPSAARSAGKFDNTEVMATDPRAAPRSGAAARFPELRGLRAGDAHGAVQPGGVRFPAPAGARGASGREARIRRARRVRGPAAECLGRGLLPGEAAGQAVFHFAGRAAPLLPVAARARRTVLGRRAAVRREDRRAHRACPCITPMRASSKSSMPAAKRAPASISTPARARRSAPARGWTIASAARTSAPSTPCRWPTWCAISCPPRPASPRCSRTTTW